MKKILVAIALVASLGTSVSFAATSTTNVTPIELSASDYTPIAIKDLPQAIQDTLAKNLSEYTVKSAAYQETKTEKNLSYNPRRRGRCRSQRIVYRKR